MKFIVVLTMVLALVGSVPLNLVSIKEKDFSMRQNFDHSNETVTRFYSWRSPEGQELFVRYVADKNGYRVVDSNALPTTVMGARADGNQSAPHRQRVSSSQENDELISKEDSMEANPSFEEESSSLEDKKLRINSKFSRRRTSKENKDNEKITQNSIEEDDDDDFFTAFV